MTIYLDALSTTPVDPRVGEEMRPWFEGRAVGNPGSPHQLGSDAAQLLAHARRRIATSFNVSPQMVVFTSGATESNNLALTAALSGPSRYVISGTTEHPSVYEPLRASAEEREIELCLLGVDREGEIDLDAFRSAIRPKCLVSLAAANNENGVVHPIAEIGSLVRAAGGLFHCDAAQAAGKVPLDMRDSCIDLLSVSGHKMYGPMGVGALLIGERARGNLRPLLRGGGQEGGLRSGTVNVPSAVGLAAACQFAAMDLDPEMKRLQSLRDRLQQRLLEVGGVQVNGYRARRLPGSLSVTIEGAPGDALLAGCPELAFSRGSACSTGSPTPSRVFLEMGLRPDEADHTVRFGLTRFTTEHEIDQAADQLRDCIERVRGLVHA